MLRQAARKMDPANAECEEMCYSFPDPRDSRPGFPDTC
jgi:hypothetical protein